jgi:integrase
MSRSLNRLSPLEVKNAKPGRLCDGGGLYLQCTTGSDKKPKKSWVFRYVPKGGRERQMGLGACETVNLAHARTAAAEYRKLLQQRIDPQDHRAAAEAAKKVSDAKAMTFDQCRDSYIAAHRAGWKNLKHAAQWKSTLQTYATPVFGVLPVGAVDTALVMKALEPIWSTKPETATRVRGRIEAILNWAKVRGYRDGENPAQWRGHLDHLLPKRSKVKAVEHHAALPYTEIGAFMIALREREGMAARALEFAILTAARTGEALGAQWDEIDVEAKLWTIPAARMSGREHRVPLSDQALVVLGPLCGKKGKTTHVFPGERRAGLSNMALLMVLRRMENEHLTAHGFRSTFRDWAGDATTFQRETVEGALAHVIGDQAEQAYRRSDALEKRRKLMEAWAAYCEEKGPAELIRFTGR